MNKLVLLTFGLVTVAIVGWFRLGGGARAAELGDYWSAVAATIAFLWLIAGYRLQNRELQLQREQLSLQRKELELQREEMRRMAEQATLGQIATMLSNFDASLGVRTMPGVNVTTVHELPGVLTAVLPHAFETLRGSSPLDRFNAYARWATVEGLAHQFLSTMATGARLYAGNTGTQLADPRPPDDAGMILENLETIRRVPHLQLYFLAAQAIAQFLSIHRAFLLRVRLAGLTAINETTPGAVESAELERLVRDVAKLSTEEGRLPSGASAR